MKMLCKISLVSLLLIHSSAWAYGGGGGSSTKACAKPKFSDFIPDEKSEVAAGADFSFIASSNTYPTTIKVTVKDQPVEIKVEDKNGTSFKVTGKLPTSLADDYARITINAEASNKCKGSGGWLVKINH